MTVRHHPSDATLLAHAAGTLPDGVALVVQTHLGLCATCRETALLAEAIGGAVLDELPPAEMAADALDRTLARLDEPAPTEPPPAIRPEGLGWPEALRTTTPGRWWWLAPGIRYRRLLPRTQAGGSLSMLRVAPGKALPHHGHRGLELTCVLEGSFTDQLGTFALGDVLEAEAGLHHRPVAGPGQDCVCLLATDSPIRFSSLAARLLQPIVGI